MGENTKGMVRWQRTFTSFEQDTGTTFSQIYSSAQYKQKIYVYLEKKAFAIDSNT